MSQFQLPVIQRRLAASAMIVSMLFAYTVPAFADVLTVNTVNDGHIVNGGDYFNTAGNKTTFVNSGAGGLYLKTGNTVRGIEVDNIGNTTGNGGWVHFSAPGQVVRLDGNVNVNALKNGGVFQGNGGRVTIDAAFLYQNGQIMANGLSGGSVQVNVGSMLMGSTASIEARGVSGNGGQVAINATDIVHIQRGAVINTSGQVYGDYDANLINIEGGLINIEGILRANGVSEVSTTDGGTIRLVAHGNAGSGCLECALDAAIAGSPKSEPLVESDLDIQVLESADAIMTPDLKLELLAWAQAQIEANNGDIHIGESGRLVANGSDALFPEETESLQKVSTYSAGNGGTILLAADRHIENDGDIVANGGDGLDSLKPTQGGNGGAIFATAGKDINNNGIIRANGGKGGDNTSSPALAGTNGSNGTDGKDGKDGYDALIPWTKGGDGTNGKNGTNATAGTAGESGRSGANGGNGGAIAFGYGRDFVNAEGAKITANGGDGGNATNGAAGGAGGSGGAGGDGGDGGRGGLASLKQKGGKGGDGGDGGNGGAAGAGGNGGNGGNAGAGGNGGLIVFSGDENPTNNGIILALGGKAGQAGLGGLGGLAGSAGAAGNGGAAGKGGKPGPILPGPAGNPGSAGDNGTAGASASNGTNGSNGSAVAGDTGLIVLANADDGVDVAGKKNNYDDLAKNEVVFHNNSLILLANGGRQIRLTSRLDNATVRAVYGSGEGNLRYGNAEGLVEESSISHLMVHNQTRRSIELDQSNTLFAFSEEESCHDSFTPNLDNLLTFTVLSKGDIDNYDSWSVGGEGAELGGHISLISKGDIYNSGSLRTYGNTSGGSIVLRAHDDISNYGTIATEYGQHGGSIIAKADGTLFNNGSWYLKQYTNEETGETVRYFYPSEGSGYIGANGQQLGGSIRLFAKNSFNLGTIEANAGNSRMAVRRTNFDDQPSEYSEGLEINTFLLGGSIISKAEVANINTGLIQANAEGGLEIFRSCHDSGTTTGQGGYIQLHGGNLSANVDVLTLAENLGINLGSESEEGYSEQKYGGLPYGPGQILATGLTQGGTVLVTAGGNPKDSLVTPALKKLIGMGDDLPTEGPGLAFETLSTPLTLLNQVIDFTQPESALNLGHIDVRGYSEGGDGRIYLAGNGQVGLGQGSSLNGVTVNLDDFTSNAAFQTKMTEVQANGGHLYLVAGQSVQGSDGVFRTAVETVACDAAPNNRAPQTVAGTEFPDDFILFPESGLDINLLGLFQQQRYIPKTDLSNLRALLNLVLGNPDMYLASQYLPVVEEILALAQAEYDTQLGNGLSKDEAGKSLQNYLAEAGLTPQAAQNILSLIEKGSLQSPAGVTNILKAMTGQAPDGSLVQ